MILKAVMMMIMKPVMMIIIESAVITVGLEPLLSHMLIRVLSNR